MNKLNEIYNKCEAGVINSPAFKWFYEKDWFKNLVDSSFCQKLINYETVSYIFFGVLTTVVNFVTAGVVVALCGSKMPDYITVNLSTAVAWIVAVIFAYITNKIFVFDSKTPNALAVVKELGAFLSARLLSLGYEAVWMNITVVYLHWYYFICKLIAQFVIVVLNYLFSKLFIFKKEKSK